MNNHPSDKESLYLIPLFTHPPFQEIKPRKEINNESAIQIMAAEKMKLIYKAKQCVLTLTMKAAKLDLRSAVKELDEKR